MPFISKAGALLLVLVVTSSIFTLTTTTVVAASSATAGGKNDFDLVRKIKNSKKTNANVNKDDTCTMEPFLGTSMYTNCKQEETEVKIACAKKGNAAADGTPTKKMCTYSEQPVQYEDAVAAAAATTAAGCGDHGSFDPETHLIRDHATGVCHLKFLRLTSTCIGAPVVAGGKFGVMVEAPLSTGPGLHSHQQNEENHHKDNSGLLLWFSIDAGATYYNTENPTRTAPLDRSSPRRKLDDDCKSGCVPPKPTRYDPNPKFIGTHTTSSWGVDTDANTATNFETCFQWKDEAKYCWSKSSRKTCFGFNVAPKSTDYECRPVHFTGDEDGWHHIPDLKYVNPVTNPYSCGEPCQHMCRNE